MAAPMEEMTLDEFKQSMFRSLRDSGATEAVRAQLRRRIIEKLAEQNRRMNDPEGSNARAEEEVEDKEESASNEDRVACGLVAEFLRERGFENTLAVFVPEIGGARNQLDASAILEMLHVPPEQRQRLDAERQAHKHSLLSVVLAELEARLAVQTADGECQTTIDCFDHRIALDNQLRRVETAYLEECASRKLEPVQSFEQRMLQYQAEYDAICDKKLQEELERYKATELALARTEERKRYEREIETLRTSLFQEHREKVRHLAEREREMELAFSTKQTNLETSLFETRQALIQEMEKLRTQEAEQQARREADFRKYTAESKRLETWEENLRAQEKNVDGLIDHRIREKERAWTLERQRLEQEYQFKLEDLRIREATLSKESDALKAAHLRASELQIQLSSTLEEKTKCEDQVARLQELVATVEKKLSKIEVDASTKQGIIESHQCQLESVSSNNAGLAAEKSNLEREVLRLAKTNDNLHSEITRLENECKALQQQMVAMKLAEANEVVTEKRKLLKTLDEERERFYWKENELLAKVRDLQTRLVESEALAEKYQSQYEDERVHVASLRHDVASLNNLLTQAHATINAKHGSVATSQRSSKLSPFDPNSHAFPPPAPSSSPYEGAFMMKMMEMMAALQGNTPSIATHPISSPQVQSTMHGSTAGGLINRDQAVSAAANEEQQLKEEQLRRERELLEQRAYEKRQKERMEEEERVLLARRKEFEDEMARAQLAQKEEAERADATRKAKLNEEEGRIKEQLLLQQKAADEARAEQELLERLRAEEFERRAQVEKEQEERRRQEVQRQVEEEEARLQRERDALKEAEKARGEAMEKELQEIQKRREQLEALEEERRKMAREREEVEVKKRELEEEALRQREADALQVKVGPAPEHVLNDQPAPDRRDVALLDTSSNSINTTIIEKPELSQQQTSIRNDGDQRTESTNSEQLDNGKLQSAIDSKTSTDVEDPPRDNLDWVKAEGDDQEETPTTEVTAANDTSAVISHEVADTEVTTTEVEQVPQRTEQELEEGKKKLEEEQKRKQDEDVIDVYRQRVLARKAAEKQRQQELEAERMRKEEEEKKAAAELAARQSFQGSGDGSENELELSDGSFAESSAASSADSF